MVKGKGTDSSSLKLNLTDPCRTLYSTVPVPQFQSFSICMSAMTRAQNMAAKGSILDEDQVLCLSGYDLSMVCPVQMKWISLRVW